MRASIHLLSLALLAMPLSSLPASADAAASDASETEVGVIAGYVRDSKTKAPIKGAVVVLQCTCLAEARETISDDTGRYAFTGLDPGTYTIQVLFGRADVSKVVTLTKGAKLRAQFAVDPSDEHRRVVKVKSAPLPGPRGGREVSMEEFRNIPLGSSANRDFTGASAGITLGADPLEQVEPSNREGYAHLDDNPFLDPRDTPLSTFGADVDTASFSNVRRFIDRGELPPKGAVRIEELLNYFPYDYEPPPENRPVAVNWEIGECPWAPEHLLVRVGLQTRPIAAKRVPPRNLVFLLDVSGSMDAPNKLPLLQRSMALLVDQLRPEDTVAIVVYAGASGIALPPTSGDEKVAIRDAIAVLEPSGSTNGAAGIRDAYALARKSFVRKGINRVILATDGDFNVGTTSDDELVRLIEKERASGVFLSVLGFGDGNLQDAKMEQLADKGNGNYAYIDTVHEARKVLVEQAGATLVTVAKDVKLQAEFNPERVASYRLIGYENRKLAAEDFDDDRKDAGEMGAGHSVTALYEVVPAGARSPARRHGRLRYQSRVATSQARGGEWMTLAVRSKPADGDRSRLQRVVMSGRPIAFARASADFRFAAAVAAYGMVLRESEHKGAATLDDVLRIAREARGRDEGGHREAFVELVRATRRVADRGARGRDAPRDAG